MYQLIMSKKNYKSISIYFAWKLNKER